ncbi:MAG: glycosyltransferase family 39 protein [bacterium]
MLKRDWNITSILTLFFYLWMGIILLFCLFHYPHYLLLFNLKNTIAQDLFLLAIITLLAYTLGFRILSICKFEFSSIQERLVFSIGSGFGILSYLIMGLGFLGLLEPKIAYGLIFVLIILLFKGLTNTIGEITRGIKSLSLKRFSWQEVIILFFIVITCGLCFLHGLCPPFDWDDLAYHLEGPKLFIEHHRIFHIPDVTFANFPANIGMLYLLGMLVGSDILSKLFHFLFGVLTMVGVFGLSQRYFNSKSSLLASAIFYICPLVIFLSRTAYIDLALTFYEFLAIFAFVNWITSYQNRWLIILAIMCGFIVGIKYPGIHTMIILYLSVIGFGVVKIGLRKMIFDLVIFGIICCLIGSPWYLKNFFYTHNPVYPYLEDLFIRKVSLTPMDIITGQTSNSVFTMGGKTLIDSLLLPWNVIIYGCLGSLPFGATISPIYLLFLPLLIFIRKLKIVGIYLFCYIVIKFILWSSGLHSSRYLLLLLPLLSSVLTSIFYTLFDSKKFLKRIILIIIFGIWTAILSWDGFQIIHYRNPINFILGFESKEDFVRRNAEKGYYNAMEFINKYLPKEAKIYFIGEKKGYYCQRNFIPDFSMWGWKSFTYKDIFQIKEYFDNKQITHILVNTTVIFCYYYPDNGVSKEEVESFNTFAQTYLKLLFQEGNLYLYGWKD